MRLLAAAGGRSDHAGRLEHGRLSNAVTQISVNALNFIKTMCLLDNIGTYTCIHVASSGHPPANSNEMNRKFVLRIIVIAILFGNCLFSYGIGYSFVFLY